MILNRIYIANVCLRFHQRKQTDTDHSKNITEADIDSWSTLDIVNNTSSSINIHRVVEAVDVSAALAPLRLRMPCATHHAMQ